MRSQSVDKKMKRGPPRDIIVKLLYYQSKEKLMVVASDKRQVLRFRGYEYHLFTDLAPRTIQKRNAMKPFLAILQQHRVG